MNKQFHYLFNIIFIIITTVALSAQSSYSGVASQFGVKAPDVAAFEAVNLFPLNEYTGRANINIPIYEINIDGIKVPVSLSYNTGGVMVDDLASRVGLGWSLNAGGMVSKSIRGKDDFAYSYIVVTENELGVTSRGYLMGAEHFSGSSNTFEGVTDGEPDLFNVSVPGIQTSFVHATNRSTVELNQQNNIIETTITPLESGMALTYPFPGWINALNQQLHFGTGINSYDVHKIKILSNQGIEYQFNEWEHIYNNTNAGTAFYHSSYPLSRLISNRTKQEINFQYERVDLYQFDSFNTTKVNSNSNNIENTEAKTSLWLKKIIRIQFDEGDIFFHYDLNRLDLPGDSALTQIEIRNKNGDLIKRTHFSYSYFLTGGCSATNCKRLRLDEIYFSNDINEYLPGYKFEYNNTILPERHAPQTDFSGYYNGTPVTTSPLSQFPTQYFYIDSNKSLLPFTINGDSNYYTLTGTYNLNASLPHAKAASLEKITYPTGGYNILNYELNSFKIYNTEIEGGGLRVKQNILYNENGIVERDINYNYITETGSTSGGILNIPKFSDVTNTNYSQPITVSNIPQNITFISQNRRVNRLNYTHGALVGYSRVVIDEIGNGKTIKEYTNPLSNPDILPIAVTNQSTGGNSFNIPKFEWLQFKIDYGFFPSLILDKGIQRGNLYKTQIFNNDNQLLNKTEFSFDHQTFQSIPIGEAFNYPNWEPYDGPCCRMVAGTNLFVERNMVTQKTETNYLENGIHIINNNYLYHSDYDFIKEEFVESAANEVLKKRWYYPIDSEVSNLPFVNSLIGKNRISTPVKTQSLLNTNLLTEEIINYSDFNSGEIIEPNSVSLQKANYPSETEVEFDVYDPENANLIQFSNKDNTPTTLIWGYNKKKVVAKIVGAIYTDVLTTGIDMDIINNPTSDSDILLELNKIRDFYIDNKAVEVVTSLYNPLVGLTQSQDEKGYNVTYSYDEFNRFQYIKDEEQNVIKENRYNYSDWQVMPEKLSAILSYESISEGVGGQYKITADPFNGSGNYRYTWTHGLTVENETASNDLIIANDEYTYIETSPGIGPDVPFPVYEFNPSLSEEELKLEYENVGWNFESSICNSVAPNPRQYIAVKCKIRDLNTGQEIQRQLLMPRFLNFPPASPASPNLVVSQLSYSNPVTYNASIYYCGGSGDFRFKWNGSNTETTFSYTQGVYSCSQSSITVTCIMRDVVTGQIFNLSSNFSADCSEEEQDCFIAGTEIEMVDGTHKLIEDVIRGDIILTYNISKKVLEKGIVENISSPIHTNFVEITFSNKKTNTNTWDHPYYVKGKGWCSYNPDLTFKNYNLKVNTLNEGDICMIYDSKNQSIKETRVTNLKPIKKKQQTFNLTEVSKNNNFFANGILVHNKSNQNK
ncbi:hypothetical protein [Changchengzhania lutea]|uniref:hypothetical protein n=1 Tax=Changchengzhania lutea TaxID=2049305 RepID=UPI00115EB27D|nr:hypothetical protein [Changchengzhania lutea]